MNKIIKEIGVRLKDGIIVNNPTFIQLLGMCPTLATTTSATNALGMGLAATAVLVISNVIISLLRKLIPNQIRIAAYIVIISGAVTVIELLMKAFLQELDAALGIFIPLIVVNCIILARAEAFASKNKVFPSLLDGLSMGLGFTGALFIIGTVREIIGSGTWLGMQVMPDAYRPATIFIMAPGAFLTLGMLIAAVNKIRSVYDGKKKMQNEPAFAQNTVKDVIKDVKEPDIEKKEPDRAKTGTKPAPETGEIVIELKPDTIGIIPDVKPEEPEAGEKPAKAQENAANDEIINIEPLTGTYDARIAVNTEGELFLAGDGRPKRKKRRARQPNEQFEKEEAATQDIKAVEEDDGK